MFFLASISVSALATAVLGLRKGYAEKYAHKYLRRSLLAGVVSIPIVGGLEGSFYSHGFDIPWWLFGLANFSVIACTAITIVGVFKLWSIIAMRRR